MTREEQIDEEAIRVAEHKDDFRFTVQYQYFIQGAEWADKTMIDKAIKWIKDNIDLVAMDTVSARSGYHEIVMMTDFEQKFRKAMEE